MFSDAKFSVAAQGAARPSQVTVSKTGTVTKLTGKAADHGGASNQPSFQTFYEVMMLVAQQIAPTAKGKVGPPSSRSKAPPSEEAIGENLQHMETKLRTWLLKNSMDSYERLLLDSQTSQSGILLKSCYKRHAYAPSAQQGSHSGNNSVAPMTPSRGAKQQVTGEPSELDVELTRLVWERNSEQVWFHKSFNWLSLMCILLDSPNLHVLRVKSGDPSRGQRAQ
jgi:hypothetical protein